MSRRLLFAAIITVLAVSGCQTDEGSAQRDDDSGGGSDPIADDKVNRYQLVLTGEMAFDHTGGLLCRVDDGVMTLDFAIDAYDGPVGYLITVPDFDPANSALEGTFTLSDSPGESTGPVELTFSYGDPPEGYEGVVRAAGAITGSMSGAAGAADITGTYACFLMDAEVGL